MSEAPVEVLVATQPRMFARAGSSSGPARHSNFYTTMYEPGLATNGQIHAGEIRPAEPLSIQCGPASNSKSKSVNYTIEAAVGHSKAVKPGIEPKKRG